MTSNLEHYSPDSILERARARVEERVSFFYQHAGYSWNPSTETQAAGRYRCAVDLATAEAIAEDSGWLTIWEADWSGDHSYLEQSEFQGYEVTTCELAYLVNAEGEPMGYSLGCIDDATPEYRRVVAAELADQALYEMRAEILAAAITAAVMS